MHVFIIFFLIFTTTKSINIENDSVPLPEQNNNNLNRTTAADCYRDSKVLYQSACYKLLTSDACHNDSEWLVLDYQSMMLSDAIILPKCVKKQCNNGQYYWPDDRKCYSDSSVQHLCPKGKELKNNVFGDGVCKCIMTPPHEPISNGSCYLLYSRGPCEPRWIFVKLQSRAQCIPDRCHTQTVSSVNRTYIFWEKTRRCYALDDRGPCSQELVLKIDPYLKIPLCSILALPSHLVGVPQTCNTDHQDNCNENINIRNPDEAFVTSLLLEADRKRQSKTKQ